MKIVRYLIFAGLVITIMASYSLAAQQSCCFRTAGTLPVPMPPGQEVDESSMIVDKFDKGLSGSGLIDCPLPVDIMSSAGLEVLNNFIKACGAQADPKLKQVRAKLHGFAIDDYAFKGTLTAANVQKIGDELYGDFTLNMKLLDKCRGQVIEERQTSWYGWIHNGSDEITALGQTFMPLDDLIHDYEGIPESVDIVPEKDEVGLEETITINLQNITDSKGRAPKPWQRLLVKAEEGQILNGVEQGGGIHVFEAGNGSVVVQYKAPEACPAEKKDTITVENSCSLCPLPAMNFIPEQEIASKEITLACGGAIEYDHYILDDQDDHIEETWITGQVPFKIEGNMVVSQGKGTIYFWTSGTFYENSNSPGCIHSYSWTNEETVSGEVVVNNNGDPELDLTVVGYPQGGTDIMTCPDPSDGWEDTYPPSPAPYISGWVLPLEDGFVLEWTYSPDDGITWGYYKVILHLD